MAEIQLVRLVLVLSMIWNVCSWTVIPEGDFELRLPVFIDGLNDQMVEDIKLNDWHKSVEIMKKHLDHSSHAYEQLNNITEYEDFPLTVVGGGYIELIQVMLQNGLPINTGYTYYHYTMLHKAAYSGQYDIAYLLIVIGADLNVKEDDGNTPLHWAATDGHLNIVQLFLEAGADINAMNKVGNTALHKAAYWGNKSVVQWLVDNGCDKTIRNVFNKTAWDIASEQEIKDILKEK